MNHYERLKVNPDAPVEVIRAAYRALAAKYHPDRHTQSQSTHAEMVALNAAYEVLADPQTRAAYDAELSNVPPPVPDDAPAGAGARFQTLWRSTMGTMGFAGMETTQPPPLAAQDEHDTRVDVHWQPPLPVGAVNPWMSRKRLLPLVGALGVVLLIIGAWWVRGALLQIEAEQTLSQHYSGQQRPGRTMSDEELMAEPPPLPGQAADVALHGNHVLDGNPLSLRQETHLIDPLLTQPAAGARP